MSPSSDPRHDHVGDSPSPATDALLLHFGDDLVAADERFRVRRGRQRRRALRIGATATALAAAGTIVVFAAGSTGPKQIDVVAEAQAALAPGPGILHIRGVVTDESTQEGQPISHVPGSFRQRWEQWRAKDPGRWRVKVWASRRHAMTSANVVQPAVAPMEVAFADGTESSYEPLRRRLYVMTGLPASHGDRPIGHFSERGDVSLEELRDLLDDGKLEDRGLTTVGGRAVRRLVGRSLGPYGSTTTYDYAVDPATFKPVRVTAALRTRPGRHGLGRGFVLRQRIDFEVFETLPASPENERLLRIEPAPGTTTITRSLDEVQTEKRARDRKLSLKKNAPGAKRQRAR